MPQLALNKIASPLLALAVALLAAHPGQGLDPVSGPGSDGGGVLQRDHGALFHDCGRRRAGGHRGGARPALDGPPRAGASTRFNTLLPAHALGANDCGPPVFRFYSAFSNSHFYTADTAEAGGLEADPNSEWKLEPDRFAIDVPGANGQCAAGEAPVFRLYNNRFAFHDSNHRFVTDAGERANMVAKGWTDEGVRFCALAAGVVPIKSYAITHIPAAKILPSPVCEDESVSRGACMAVNNLTAPSTPFPPQESSKMPADFFNRTGLNSSFDFVKSAQAGAPPALAQDVFVQLDGNTLGIHVDTQNRGASMYSSVNPLYQFHSSAAPGTFDDRFFPWTGYESGTELKVSFTLNVKTVNVIGAGSAAYGHPTLEFIDQRSGHHLYFTVLTYDDRPITDDDYLAPDVGSGKVIVGTTFRASSPYVRSFGLTTLHTPPGFVAPNSWGWAATSSSA